MGRQLRQMAESPVHSALGDDEAEADAAESPVLIAMRGPMSPEPPETPHSPDSQLLKQTTDAQAHIGDIGVVRGRAGTNTAPAQSWGKMMFGVAVISVFAWLAGFLVATVFFQGGGGTAEP